MTLSNRPEVGFYAEPDPEDGPCDGLDGGVDCHQGYLPGGFLHVAPGSLQGKKHFRIKLVGQIFVIAYLMVDECADFLRVHLPQSVKGEVAVLKLLKDFKSGGKILE